VVVIPLPAMVIVRDTTVEVFCAASVTVTVSWCGPPLSPAVSTGTSTNSLDGQGCCPSNMSAPLALSVPTGTHSPELLSGVAS
jgi:hypothetical protein